MPSLSFLVRRIVKALVVLVCAAALNFLVIRLAPGDAASVMAGEAGAADQTYMTQLRKEFGLDRSIDAQLLIYLQQVGSFDLGYSYRQQTKVSVLILDRLPATLILTATAFCFALIVGVGLGAFAAANRGRWVDRVIGTLVLVFYATPIFWTGLVGVLIFSVWLGWLPAFGIVTIGAEGGGGVLADLLEHLALPALTLGLFHLATYARLTRAAMLDVYALDFVKTARAKGLPPGRIIGAHVLRNALLPVITMAGLQAGQLVGGAVLVETVFAWPGIGRLAFDALMQRDYSVLLGVFLTSSAMVLFFNLLTDLLYSLVDPRIEVTT